MGKGRSNGDWSAFFEIKPARFSVVEGSGKGCLCLIFPPGAQREGGSGIGGMERET